MNIKRISLLVFAGLLTVSTGIAVLVTPRLNQEAVIIPASPTDASLPTPLLKTKTNDLTFPNPTPVDPDTAKWLTYTDAENKYSVKFPPSMKSDGNGEFSLVENTVPDRQAAVIKVFSNPGNLTFTEWIKTPEADTGYGPGNGEIKKTSMQTVVINGINWIEFLANNYGTGPGFPPSGSYDWATVRNKKVYMAGEINVPDGWNIVRLMIKTFKFIN